MLFHHNGNGEGIGEIIQKQSSYIARHQLPGGAIPYFEGGVIDPWDHVDCAIALSLSGYYDRATLAYEWLKQKQNPDGSWYFYYQDGHVSDFTRDTNHSAYIAVGVWYHYLVTRDRHFLQKIWPTVERAVNFSLSLQQDSGEIWCALNPEGKPWPGALLAASSCVWRSLRCAIRIARELGIPRPEWEIAAEKLKVAILHYPELFDKFGENRQNYSMNWYYPVMVGLLQGSDAEKRLEKDWGEFIIPDWGCKCVSCSPWVTVAETCELIFSLAISGEDYRAKEIFSWIMKLKDGDIGGFYTGIKVPEQVIWPFGEKPTWTAAAVVIALTGIKHSIRGL